MTSFKIILKPGRDKSVRQKHPWIFASAIQQEDVTYAPGDTTEVYSASGELLGRAAYNPNSQIRARMWTYHDEEMVDREFFRRQLQSALDLRRDLLPFEANGAMRLVHAESDGLPGVIVDRYQDFLVLQLLTAGADFWKETIADLLVELTGAPNLFERSDVDVRQLEGLPQKVGTLRGVEPPPHLFIQENGLKFQVDISRGQKTGFYLDQRANRQRVRQLVAGRSVLNCFCYTAAFSVYALAGGASQVLSVDSSAEALGIGAENIKLNGFQPEKATWLEGDVFTVLRTLRDRAQTFDAIILDPPKFAPTSAQAERASRGYKDINLLAFKLLRPGGLLFTFSCSGGISADLFQKIVTGAALDTGVQARIVDHLSQDSDHPVALNFPEGAYLKGLVCRVI